MQNRRIDENIHRECESILKILAKQRPNLFFSHHSKNVIQKKKNRLTVVVVV